jgi:type VI protein secretion system component Hcp
MDPIQPRIQLQIEHIESDLLKEPIAIQCWNWCLSAHLSEYERDQGIPLCTPQDITLTKSMGLETPPLLKLLAEGRKIPRAVLTIGGQPSTVMVLKEAQLTCYSTGGSNSDERAYENFTLTFREIEIRCEDKSRTLGPTSSRVEIVRR